MSSESNFSFTTKFNGDLFTVRGDTVEQFSANISAVVDALDTLTGQIGTIQAAGHAAPLVAPAPAATQAAPAAQTYTAPTPAPQATNGDGPLCEHGQPMRLVPAGIAKSTGRPYKAFYACAQPRGQQCNARHSL